MSEQDPNAIVSVEDADGRILSGVGVAETSLQETIEAREPVETTEAAAPSPAPAEAVPPAPRDPQTGKFEKGRHSPAKKIGQLTAQRTEADQARQAAEQRAEALERRLAALEASRAVPAAQAPPSSPQAPPSAPPQARQKPSEDEIGVKYASYADFAEDLADWKLESRFGGPIESQLEALVRKGIEADRASRAQQEYVQSFGTRARAVYPDFDAVLASAEEIQFPDLKILINAPNSEHLVYALAKNPVLARQIAQERDPIRLGYLMASVGPSSAGASPAPPAKTVASSAPAPYQPVGSSTKTSTPTLDEIAAKGQDYDSSGYRERRRAERSRR